MRDGRVGAEGRSGSEYVILGEDGDLHLPADIASTWTAGTVVQIESDGDDRLTISRADAGGHDAPTTPERR